MAAILQACEMSENLQELVPLDIEMQRDVVGKYLDLYPAFSSTDTELHSYRNCWHDQDGLLITRREREPKKRVC